jgi:hypothetical protein
MEPYLMAGVDRSLLAVLATITGSCSPPVSEPAPKVRVETSEPSKTTFITIEADTIIGDRRPEMTLECETGEEAGLQLLLVQTPPSPPPLRGNPATFRIDDTEPREIELGYSDESRWSVRLPHAAQMDTAASDRQNRKTLTEVLQRFLNGKTLEITTPAHLGLVEPVRWSASTFGSQMAAARECVGFKPPA